jgi:hypothetical protein
MSLEKLDRAFVFFGSGSTAERTKIAAPARFWIRLPRVQTILT